MGLKTNNCTSHVAKRALAQIIIKALEQFEITKKNVFIIIHTVLSEKKTYIYFFQPCYIYFTFLSNFSSLHLSSMPLQTYCIRLSHSSAQYTSLINWCCPACVYRVFVIRREIRFKMAKFSFPPGVVVSRSDLYRIPYVCLCLNRI